MLPRRHRLHRSRDFTVVIRGGVRVAGRHVVIHLCSIDAGDRLPGIGMSAPGPQRPVSRVGLVVGRSVGPSVTRSLVSRRLRAHMGDRLTGRLGGPPLAPGLDIVIRALPSSATASWPELTEDVDRALGRALGRLSSARRPTRSPGRTVGHGTGTPRGATR